MVIDPEAFTPEQVAYCLKMRLVRTVMAVTFFHDSTPDAAAQFYQEIIDAAIILEGIAKDIHARAYQQGTLEQLVTRGRAINNK